MSVLPSGLVVSSIFRRIMIYQLSTLAPHIITIEEKDENMQSFLEEMADIYVKYECGKFRMVDGYLYKATLIKKVEFCETIKATQTVAKNVFSWTVKSKRTTVLEYHFEPIFENGLPAMFYGNGFPPSK